MIEVAGSVAETLRNMPLRENYSNEEKDLHPHIQLEIDRALSSLFPDRRFLTTLSVGGPNRPRVDLLGTNFWPDLAITEKGKPIIGIEAKLVRKGAGASKPIAEGIGQAVIYSCLYPRVFVFIAHSGIHNEKLVEHDETLLEVLTPINLDLIVRRIPDVTKPTT